MASPIKVVKGGTLIPDYGNEGRSDDEKIQVTYRFLSFAEQQELLDPSKLGTSMAYESKVIAKMITKIENLEVQEGNEVRAITDGDALVSEPGLDVLAKELWLTLRTMSAVDKKK